MSGGGPISTPTFVILMAGGLLAAAGGFIMLVGTEVPGSLFGWGTAVTVLAAFVTAAGILRFARLGR